MTPLVLQLIGWILAAASAVSGPGAPYIYPPVRSDGTVETQHGVSVPDPYRWLEDLDSEGTRQWVEAHGEIAKPSMPTSRGGLTIEDVRHATTPVMYAHAVDRWARATWTAYAPLHETVRAWIREALDAEARPRR